MLFGTTAAAQGATRITGTFKTAGAQTPTEAVLRQVDTVATIAVYGTVDFHPTDSAGRTVNSIVCGGVTYVPQNVRAWIKGDGQIIDITGTLGVVVVPTIGCQPVGVAYRATISLAGSVNGNLAPASWTESKEVPDVSSVDWASLPPASLQTPAFSIQLGSHGLVVDYEDWAATTGHANPATGFGRVWYDTSLQLKCKTATGADCAPGGGGSGSQHSIDGVNLTSNDPVNFQDSTTIDFSNPSAGNVGATIKADSLTDAMVQDTIALANLTQLTTRNYSDLQSIPSTFAPAAHALAGADHTASGLTAGQVVRAATATTFAWAQLGFSDLSGSASDAQVPDTITLANLTQLTTRNYSDLQSIPATFAPAAHALAGADHTAAGLTVGHVLRASGATTFAWAQLGFSDLSGSASDAQVVDTITAANYLPLAGGILTGDLELDNQKELRLREADANGDNYIGFRATAARAANLTLEWDVTGDCTGTNGGLLTVLASRIVCQDDDGGAGGGGDNVSVNGVAAADADFDDATPAAPASAVNVKWQKDALSPNNLSAYLLLTDIDGAGIGVSGSELVTASTEANFLADGGVTSLTCGASAQGKMQALDSGALEYCDGAATSVLQTAERQANKNAASGYAGLTAGTKLTKTQGDELWNLTDLLDVLIATPAGGDVLCYDGTDVRWENCNASGYDTVAEEGSALTKRAIVNFIGAALTAADNAGSSRTDVTLSQSPSASASVVGTGRALTAGAGIAALGDLSADRTIALKYSDTLAADPALNAEECVFTTDGTGGGGFLCEGTVANTNEQLYLFPALDGVDTTSFIALGDSSGAALAGDSATAFFASGTIEDARIDGSAEADELVLAGDVDGAANANDLDEVAVEAELEAVLDLPDLQGILTAAKGGTGDDTSATTGVPRIAAGNWTYDAGISHLASSTSADLAGVLSNETGSGLAVFNDTPALTTPDIGSFTVAGLPAAGTLGRVAIVTDGTAKTDCTTGGGSTKVWCMDDGAAWTSASGAAGGGGLPDPGANGIVVRTALDTTTARTMVAGAGLSGSNLDGVSGNPTLTTASSEADFLASGALTCGAATQGKAQVHTTPLQYCDNAATPALQYAAYGDSAGAALAGDSATAFFAAGTIEDARLSANVSLLGSEIALTTETSGNYAADVTAGAGLAKTSSAGEGQTVDLAVDSSEADFLKSGALVCGAATQGKAQVHTTPLQYCDNAATPALRYTAYGDSAGDATGIAANTVVTADIQADQVTRDKVSAVLRTRQFVFLLGAKNAASALADADDEESIWINHLGSGITVIGVNCESDAGTPSINLQRDDGVPANILSANLSCSTSDAAGTVDTAEDNVADGQKIDFVMVTAGGTAKRVTVTVKYTVD